MSDGLIILFSVISAALVAALVGFIPLVVYMRRNGSLATVSRTSAVMLKEQQEEIEQLQAKVYVLETGRRQDRTTINELRRQLIQQGEAFDEQLASQKRVTDASLVQAQGTIDLLEVKVEDLEAHNKALEAKVAHLEDENDRLAKGIGALVDQLIENGIKPAWRPTKPD